MKSVGAKQDMHYLGYLNSSSPIPRPSVNEITTPPRTRSNQAPETLLLLSGLLRLLLPKAKGAGSEPSLLRLEPAGESRELLRSSLPERAVRLLLLLLSKRPCGYRR